MSTTAALALVRQVQSLAEAPEALAEQGCLGQVISFLECCLGHSDSRTRLAAARALLTLSSHCGESQWRSLGLGGARRALARCEEAIASGAADDTAVAMQRLLAASLHRDARGLADSSTGGSERGEVRLRVPVAIGDEAKAAIRKAIVLIPGVVSVTFEASNVVVSTRTSETAANSTFIADLCAGIREQLVFPEGSAPVARVECGFKLGDSCADTCSFADYADEPDYLDDSEDEGGEAAEASFLSDEPAYLDDEDEEEDSTLQDPRLAQPWTFFGTPYWFTAQRLQEREEDPTIVARLARARQRQEKRQREEQTRLRRLLSVITAGQE